MPHTPATIHARLVRAVHTSKRAMRADHTAINQFAGRATDLDIPDEATTAFLKDTPPTDASPVPTREHLIATAPCQPGMAQERVDPLFTCARGP